MLGLHFCLHSLWLLLLAWGSIHPATNIYLMVQMELKLGATTFGIVKIVLLH